VLRLPHVLNHPDVFGLKFLVPDIRELLLAPATAHLTCHSGKLFTAHDHTSAVVCDTETAFFVFDSAVASVWRMARYGLGAGHTAVHEVEEFDASLWYFDGVSAPSPPAAIEITMHYARP
jgi:hypothetical protein